MKTITKILGGVLLCALFISFSAFTYKAGPVKTQPASNSQYYYYVKAKLVSVYPSPVNPGLDRYRIEVGFYSSYTNALVNAPVAISVYGTIYYSTSSGPSSASGTFVIPAGSNATYLEFDSLTPVSGSLSSVSPSSFGGTPIIVQ